MKCFIGIEKKLEDNTMFYREPANKIDVIHGLGFFYLLVICETFDS